MAPQLTEGAIKTIMSGGEVIDPIVQVLGSKVIPGNGATERFRILISDGVYLQSFATLATQLNPMLLNGELPDYSIVKITNHVVSTFKNPDKPDKKVLVIVSLEVLSKGDEVGMKIGHPVLYTESNSSAPANAPAPAQPEPQVKAAIYSSRKSINETLINSPMNTTKTHPIMSLSPYQNNWVIKARVTSKSSVRTWSNAKGEGKLFSVDLVDESGEIRATAFREQVDSFYELLEENKVFFISKGQLKMANKKFTNLNHDFEITFTRETKIVPCLEDDSSIPSLQFNFIKLSAIQEAQAGNLVDVIGVCKSAGEIVNLVSKTTNRELKKKDLLLVDPSLVSVTLTLWGNQAEEFNGDNNPVIALKGGKVSEFGGGKTLSLVGGSAFQVNPDIPEAHKLRGWYDCLTDDAKFNSISSKGEGGGGGKFYLLGEAMAAKLGCGDKADYFNCYATVMHIRTEKTVYKACPTTDCNKKVVDQNTGQYRCEKCNREFDDFKYRLMLSVNIGDFSSTQWVTLFQDTAEELLGKSAQVVGKLQEEDDNQYNEIFKKVTLMPFQFRIRAKMETYNDENRLKLSVFSVKKPDYKERCRRLISEIKEMVGLGASS